MGAFIFCTSLFGLVVIWRKHYKLIFLSGIFLLIIFVTLIVITTVKLTLDYEKTEKSDRVKLIAQVTTESILQIIAIVTTFFMSTRRPFSNNRNETIEHDSPDIELETQPMDRSFDRRSKRSYNLIPSKEDNGLDM